ncbi:MAG: glycosyltransferase family 4 protein [Bacilli bacterium]|nr:glycosyltransferase family 4 protein [Bacilli bacterium]
MRIGIFTDTYPPFINGVSTSISMLEKALKQKGHQVFIVTVNPDNMTYKYENDNHVIRIPGIPIGIYDYRLTGIYPVRVINKIKKWDLDVIHSHTEFGIGTFARIIAHQLDIPLVHTYHTMYEDYVHYITRGHFDKSSKKIVEYLTKFYCDKTASELIVPSKKTYNLFKEKYKVDKNVHIVPTGIDINRFYKEKINKELLMKLREKWKIKKQDFVILFVGRLAKEKNIELLIESHHTLVKKYPNIKLMVVGSGPDYDHYNKMIEKYNIKENVILTNAVPWEKIPEYYALADVFATASSTETQGLTVIEAMAASLPVVCMNDESFTNVVIDGLNGKLFRTKREYKKCIESLINNKEQLKSMSNQARITSESHSLKYYAEQILDVYKSAIGDKYKKDNIVRRIKRIISG